MPQPTFDKAAIRPEVARVLGEALAFHKFAVEQGFTGEKLARFTARIPQDHKDVFAAYAEANGQVG